MADGDCCCGVCWGGASLFSGSGVTNTLSDDKLKKQIRLRQMNYWVNSANHDLDVSEALFLAWGSWLGGQALLIGVIRMKNTGILRISWFRRGWSNIRLSCTRIAG